MSQRSFSDLEYSAKRKQRRRDRFLGEIDAITPWAALVEAIDPHYPKGKRGRPPIGLERLLRMPLDELKIDMTFVHELSASPPHQRIVESMVGLGHKLGLTVVAEGVEDEDTLTRLRALDCDLVQGFYLGRPARLGYFMEQMLRTRD